MLALLLRIDARSGVPAYRQIAGGLRALLVQNSLRPGEQLPPVRQLALDLGVHFNTVAAGYRVLAGEGWLTLKRRRGAVVVARKTPEPAPELAEAFGRRLRDVIAEQRAAGVNVAALVRELRQAAEALRK